MDTLHTVVAKHKTSCTQTDTTTHESKLCKLLFSSAIWPPAYNLNHTTLSLLNEGYIHWLWAHCGSEMLNFLFPQPPQSIYPPRLYIATQLWSFGNQGNMLFVNFQNSQKKRRICDIAWNENCILLSFTQKYDLRFNYVYLPDCTSSYCEVSSGYTWTNAWHGILKRQEL